MHAWPPLRVHRVHRVHLPTAPAVNVARSAGVIVLPWPPLRIVATGNPCDRLAVAFMKAHTGAHAPDEPPAFSLNRRPVCALCVLRCVRFFACGFAPSHAGAKRRPESKNTRFHWLKRVFVRPKRWSGRGESNHRIELGKLTFCH